MFRVNQAVWLSFGSDLIDHSRNEHTLIHPEKKVKEVLLTLKMRYQNVARDPQDNIRWVCSLNSIRFEKSMQYKVRCIALALVSLFIVALVAMAVSVVWALGHTCSSAGFIIPILFTIVLSVWLFCIVLLMIRDNQEYTNLRAVTENTYREGPSSLLSYDQRQQEVQRVGEICRGYELETDEWILRIKKPRGLLSGDGHRFIVHQAVKKNNIVPVQNPLVVSDHDDLSSAASDV